MKKLLKYSWVLIVPVMAVAAFVWRASALDYTELLPVPGDCSAFYSVRNGVAILMHCPEGLIFNDELDVCDYPRNVVCEEKKEEVKKRDCHKTVTTERPDHPNVRCVFTYLCKMGDICSEELMVYRYADPSTCTVK